MQGGEVGRKRNRILQRRRGGAVQVEVVLGHSVGVDVDGSEGGGGVGQLRQPYRDAVLLEARTQHAA